MPDTEPLDEAGEAATAVLYALLTERHAVRHELDLPHDSLDEMAEELETAIEDEERLQLEAELSVPVLFFPRAEFDGLAALLPEVARVMGPTWDEHRADLERALVATFGGRDRGRLPGRAGLRGGARGVGRGARRRRPAGRRRARRLRRRPRRSFGRSALAAGPQRGLLVRLGREIQEVLPAPVARLSGVA